MEKYLYEVDTWQDDEILNVCAKEQIEIVGDDGRTVTFKGTKRSLKKLHDICFDDYTFNLVEA